MDLERASRTVAVGVPSATRRVALCQQGEHSGWELGEAATRASLGLVHEREHCRPGEIDRISEATSGRRRQMELTVVHRVCERHVVKVDLDKVQLRLERPSHFESRPTVVRARPERTRDEGLDRALMAEHQKVSQRTVK